jgi:UDP-glucuronate 4-epimerase
MLVTGGAGFIGSTLCERLTGQGREVVCLDNFCDYYDPALKRNNLRDLLKKKNFRLLEADIRDAETLRRVFREHRFDTVVHLAAQPGVRLSLQDPNLYMDVNVKGTVNVLEAARETGVRKLVFGSSSSVYGASRSIPFREDGELFPISPYGVSKRTGELLCATYRHLYGISMTVLRFFTVYGPRQRPDMAIHKFIRQVDEGRRITLFGDGLSRRDYTFVADIVDGITAAVERDFEFETFNLGDSDPVPLNELIAAIERGLGRKADIEYLPDQAGDPTVTFADISRAAAALDYCPKVRIEEGVGRFIDWYRAGK